LSFRQLLNNIRFCGRGGLNVRRYWIWKALQARTHAELWTHPAGYYFCNVIAVSSEMRGMGVGRRLVEAVTGRADAEGVPCYLESSKGEPNLGIYEKLGFRVVKEIECVDGWEACKVISPFFFNLRFRGWDDADEGSCIAWCGIQRSRSRRDLPG
jgi:GNAT superfamily N-acetyltransferase